MSSDMEDTHKIGIEWSIDLPTT